MIIYYGCQKKAVTAAIHRSIKEKIAQKNDGNLLIVPEQYSFDAELLLCRYCGNTVSRYAEVLSFKRLYSRAASLYGGVCRKILDDETKLLALSIALDQIDYRLKYFTKHRQVSSLLDDLSAELTEFKRHGIRWQDLEKASKQVEGITAQKLEELALILETYDNICRSNGTDPSEVLYYLSDILWSTGYSIGKTFYFDGFLDFTADEAAVLRTLIRKGADVVAGFVCDDPYDGADAFKDARSSIHFLQSSCKSFGQSVELVHVSDNETHLHTHLFQSYADQSKSCTDKIQMIQCRNLRDECEQAACRVLDIVRAGGRYYDIAVTCPDIHTCIPMLQSAFREANIPYYFTDRHTLASEPLFCSLLDGMEACINGYPLPKMLPYLKSPFSGITNSQAFELERYLSAWGIDGKLWHKDWNMSPSGLGSTDCDLEILNSINLSRKTVIGPLSKLEREFSAASTVSQFTRAVIRFFKNIRLKQSFENILNNSFLQEYRAAEIEQLYSGILQSFEQLTVLLGESMYSPTEYFSLLRKLCSNYQIKTIPPTADAVFISDYSGLRFSIKHYLIALDSSNNSYLESIADSSIISDSERALLKRRTNLTNLPTRKDILNRNYYALYQAVTCWDRGMAVYFSDADTSYLLSRIKGIYPELPVINLQVVPVYQKKHLSRLLQYDFSALSTNISEQITTICHGLHSLSDFHPENINPDLLSNFLPNILELSPTRLSCYQSCPAKYYYRYMLGLADELSPDFGANLKGTMIHAVMESVLKQVYSQTEARTETEILSIIHEETGSIIKKFFPDFLLQSGKYGFLISQTSEEIVRFVLDALKELSCSEFTPQYFEYPVTETIFDKLNHEKSVIVKGTIDRVDSMTLGEKKYYRVIDYKTGGYPGSYRQILEGTGLQPVFYLSVLQDGDTNSGTEELPAGFLYHSPCDVLQKADHEGKQNPGHKRHGILLNDKTVLNSMEHYEDAPVFLPYSIDQNGILQGDIASDKDFSKLFCYVKNKIIETDKGIRSGTFNEIDGILVNDSCSSCSYISICRKKIDIDFQCNKKQISKENFWKAIYEKEEPSNE